MGIADYNYFTGVGLTFALEKPESVYAVKINRVLRWFTVVTLILGGASGLLGCSVVVMRCTERVLWELVPRKYREGVEEGARAAGSKGRKGSGGKEAREEAERVVKSEAEQQAEGFTTHGFLARRQAADSGSRVKCHLHGRQAQRMCGREGYPAPPPTPGGPGVFATGTVAGLRAREAQSGRAAEQGERAVARKASAGGRGSVLEDLLDSF